VALGSQDMQVWAERSYGARGRNWSHGAVADPRGKELDRGDHGAVSQEGRPSDYRKHTCAMGAASSPDARGILRALPLAIEFGVYDPGHGPPR
jgi:hypothetical protein